MAWNSKERSIGRVGTSMDVGRAAAAVRGPGIDTRTWFSLAIINAMTVTSEGAFAQVTLHPSGDVHNARCGGSELWEPLNIDDEVVVAWPSGDPMEGLVVVRRLGSAADPPDKRVVNAPGDLWLVSKPGIPMHVVSGDALELGAEKDVTVHSAGGDVTVASDSGAVTVTVGAGQSVTVNVGAGGSINLGGNMFGVARQGDTVQAGPFPGTITKASLLVKAG